MYFLPTCKCNFNLVQGLFHTNIISKMAGVNNLYVTLHETHGSFQYLNLMSTPSSCNIFFFLPNFHLPKKILQLNRKKLLFWHNNINFLINLSADLANLRLQFTVRNKNLDWYYSKINDQKIHSRSVKCELTIRTASPFHAAVIVCF